MISSVKNPRVAAAVRLHKRALREQDRRFLVEGSQGVREALASEPAAVQTLFVDDELHELAIRARRDGIEVVHGSPAVLARLSSTVTPQGVVAVAPFIDVDLGAIGSTGCVAVLHEVRDPGNAGTILRSADAAGSTAVVFTTSSVDLYNAKAVRASAGSVFHVPVVRDVATDDALAALRARGFRLLAMDAHGDEPLDRVDLTGPVAFVFGNEAHGLSPDVVARADTTVRVPQRGRAESLNLAAAATVCLFEWTRRHESPADRLDALIAAAAHDIRSPLTAMKGFSFALERRWAEMHDDERALMVRGIAHDVDRMDQTLRLLVDASRLASDTFEAYPDRVDLQELVGEIDVQQARDPEHPSLVWHGDPGPYFVDPTRVRTAILAFDEALRWWASTGSIDIVVAQGGGDLVLTASRAGASIAPDEVGGLFQPRRPGSGGGSKIGLYVVHGVAARLGGAATAAVDGDRLSFTLRLPVT